MAESEDGKTHESQTKHHHGTNSMRQHSLPKNIHVARTHPQIPQKIPQRKSLYKPRRARISPHPPLPAQRRSFVVVIQHPQTRDAHNAALDEADNVHVPVDARAGVEGVVDFGDEGLG